MNRTAVLVLAIATASFALPAHAQFSKLKGLAGGSSNADADAGANAVAVPDEAAQEALVQRFIASQSQSLRAQTAFAKAFGLADQVQLLEAESMALSSGSVSTDAMKKASSVSESAQAAIDERQGQQPELSAEARGHYAEGLVALLASVVEGRKLVAEAGNFSSGMQNMGALQMASLGRKLLAGAWVAKESPGYMKGLYSSSKSALTFARAANIDVPANADSMLDSL